MPSILESVLVKRDGDGDGDGDGVFCIVEQWRRMTVVHALKSGSPLIAWNRKRAPSTVHIKWMPSSKK